MRFDIVTLFPAMFSALTEHGVSGRALAAGLAELHTWNPRDDTTDRHRTVDDRPYGGGPGMVMKVEPLRDCLRRARAASTLPATTLYLSPQGQPLDQPLVRRLAGAERLILLAGRYEGVDERLIKAEVDAELSLGDYVLSGGELAAMVLIDAIVRLLPGALGAAGSAANDSFSAATGLLDHPHYTRPERIDGRAVPAVLLGGDHDAVRRWRLRQALGRTWLRRPELLTGRLDAEQRRLLDDFIREYCLAENTGASA